MATPIGHMISLNLSDDDDVSLRKQSLIGQINTVLCRFGQLDPTVKNRLFQAYCCSHYVSKLWNLDCDKITEYCSTVLELRGEGAAPLVVAKKLGWRGPSFGPLSGS